MNPSREPDQTELGHTFDSAASARHHGTETPAGRTTRAVVGSIGDTDLEVLATLAAVEGPDTMDRTLQAHDDRIDRVWRVVAGADGRRYGIVVSLDHDPDEGGAEIAFGVIEEHD